MLQEELRRYRQRVGEQEGLLATHERTIVALRVSASRSPACLPAMCGCRAGSGREWHSRANAAMAPADWNAPTLVIAGRAAAAAAAAARVRRRDTRPAAAGAGVSASAAAEVRPPAAAACCPAFCAFPSRAFCAPLSLLWCHLRTAVQALPPRHPGVSVPAGTPASGSCSRRRTSSSGPRRRRSGASPMTWRRRGGPRRRCSGRCRRCRQGVQAGRPVGVCCEVLHAGAGLLH